jgi:hypothetical protein
VNIALVDIQPVNKRKIYPNLVLMKLSAYHKGKGDDVDLFVHTSKEKVDAVIWGYEKVYASMVFNFIRKPILPEHTNWGGTGIDLTTILNKKIDALCPDYALYNLDYSMGFFTRGCPHHCPWCVVPEKEGDIQPYRKFEDFIRHDKAVLMDNNVLACDWGILQIERASNAGIAMDFNQGLDARLIDPIMARMLSGVKWLAPVRLACDSEAGRKHLAKAVKRLREAGVTPSRYSVYTLVTDDIEESYERIQFVKSLNCSPFAQPYRDKIGTAPSKISRMLADWVNIAPMNQKYSFEDFCNFKDKALDVL